MICSTFRRYVLFALPVLLAILLGLTAAAYAAPIAQDTPPVSPPLELPSARRGRMIYQENCASCHGRQGLGEGPLASELEFPPAQFADAAIARQTSLARWFHIAKSGRAERMMPAWGDRLSDQEIWDALAYAWTLHQEEGELDQGRTIYQERCARCHGENGLGDGPEAPPDMPDLTSFDTLDRSLASWFDVVTEGRNDMPGFADTLTEGERWAAVEYVRSFVYRPLTPPTYEPGEGVIRGSVTNATPSGPVPSGITVTLRVFDSETFDEVRNFETTLGEDGTFRFEGLSSASEWSYMVMLDYAGVPYASDVRSFPEGSSELDLPVTVYEPTEDGSGIRIERAHWFIDFEGQSLLIGEMYIISQDGDRVYVGGEQVAPDRRVTLRFPLPAGYQDLGVDPGPIGQRFFVVEDAVVDTLPVPPGQGIRQVMIRYRYPYQGKRLEFQHVLAYPVAHLNVLVNDVGVKVSSSQVTFQGKRGGSGQQFLNLAGSDIPAGEVITLSFEDLPHGDETRAAVGSPVVLVAVIVALAGALAAIGYLIWQRQREVPAMEPSAPADLSELEMERERLILSIARLDDEYEAGNIDEDVYQRERSARKARLLEVIQQIQELSES